MREFREFKLFKINKNKPIQFKRNLLIEKCVDNYLTNQYIEQSANLSIKSINQKREENKSNCFIKKKSISKKILTILDHDETESTTFISNYKNKTNKSNSFCKNISSRIPPNKSKTFSCSNYSQNKNKNKFIMQKKNAGKSFSLRTKSKKNLNSNNSYSKKHISNKTKLKIRNSNIDFFREYERISKSQKSNNKSFIKTLESKNDSCHLFRKKLSNIINGRTSSNKIQNRLYSKNEICSTLEKTIAGFNKINDLNGLNSINKKIHK